jgi:hypothetical protein
VTLTPVTRIDRFPFSGGLAAGVEIEPAGLDLILPATLTIRTTSPAPVDRTLPYAYERGGEDFILYPRAVDTSSLRLPLVRFGGYGAGHGDAAEGMSQADRIPSGPLAPYLQRYAREVLRRVLGQISQAELLDRGNQISEEAFADLVAPLLGITSSTGVAPASTQVVECPLGTDERRNQLVLQGLFQDWANIRQRQLMLREEDQPDSALDTAREILRACMQASFERCVSLNDPYEAILMAQINRQLQLMAEEDPLVTTFMEGSLVERCLRFELDFESKIVLVDTSRDAGGTTRLQYRSAHVPLRFDYAGNFYARSSIWEGGCSLLTEVATLELPYGFGDCSFTADGGKDWFSAAAAWISLLDDPLKSAVTLLYDPGNPHARATLTCDDGPIELNIFQWRAEYAILHQNEGAPLQDGPGFIAKGWDPLRFGPGPSQNGEFFARKSYERGPLDWRPNLTAQEETWFFLKHTPDKAMPECP